MGQNFLDQYSLLHFAMGIIAYFLGISFWIWFFLHLLFEIVENSEQGMIIINKFFFFWPGKKEFADSLSNSLGDQFTAMLGWYAAYIIDSIGKKNRWYKSPTKQPIKEISLLAPFRIC